MHKIAPILSTRRICTSKMLGQKSTVRDNMINWKKAQIYDSSAVQVLLGSLLTKLQWSDLNIRGN